MPHPWSRTLIGPPSHPRQPRCRQQRGPSSDCPPRRALLSWPTVSGGASFSPLAVWCPAQGVQTTSSGCWGQWDMWHSCCGPWSSSRWERTRRNSG
eukprot:5152434-Lingulodinium_polyedra.AAC.1